MNVTILMWSVTYISLHFMYQPLIGPLSISIYSAFLYAVVLDHQRCPQPGHFGDKFRHDFDFYIFASPKVLYFILSFDVSRILIRDKLSPSCSCMYKEWFLQPFHFVRYFEASPNDLHILSGIYSVCYAL